jgi:long-chain acyl-CoA synthetase
MLKKYKPTILFGVPTLYEAMINAKGLDKLDFSFLKYAISGGDSLPKALEDKVNVFLCSHNSSVCLCEGYGMTEGLAALSLSVNNAYKSGSIGKPLVGNRMCVVSPGTTNVLPFGEEGELCVTGPTIMLGYKDNEKETVHVLKIHDDGKVWLHTGDMAVIDSEGFVHYKLRIKRMIISSGYNVYPTQVEKIIEELPEVDKCAVVSMPHPYKKEVPKAFIILAKDVEGNDSILDKIKKHCEKKLSHHSVPYKYQFVKELPKTPYGKVDIMKLQSEEQEVTKV